MKSRGTKDDSLRYHGCPASSWTLLADLRGTGVTLYKQRDPALQSGMYPIYDCLCLYKQQGVNHYIGEEYIGRSAY